jgi:RnfABCDGE-type electron transport complex G subunit
MKSKYLEYGGKLALICLACMFGVGGAYVMAMGSIAEGKAAAVYGAITAVLKAGDDEPAIAMTDLTEKDGIYLYTTPEGEKRYAAQGLHQGFSGKVVVAVGAREVDGRLTIIKMRVISQTETPGLGTRIAEQSSNLTLWTKIGSALGAEVTEVRPFPFLDQYEGKDVDNMMLTGDAGESETKIVKITGVTISSNAATVAAKKALTRIQESLP